MVPAAVSPPPRARFSSSSSSSAAAAGAGGTHAALPVGPPAAVDPVHTLVRVPCWWMSGRLTRGEYLETQMDVLTVLGCMYYRSRQL